MQEKLIYLTDDRDQLAKLLAWSDSIGKCQRMTEEIFLSKQILDVAKTFIKNNLHKSLILIYIDQSVNKTLLEEFVVRLKFICKTIFNDECFKFISLVFPFSFPQNILKCNNENQDQIYVANVAKGDDDEDFQSYSRHNKYYQMKGPIGISEDKFSDTINCIANLKSIASNHFF